MRQIVNDCPNPALYANVASLIVQLVKYYQNMACPPELLGR